MGMLLMLKHRSMPGSLCTSLSSDAATEWIFRSAGTASLLSSWSRVTLVVAVLVDWITRSG